LVKEDRASKWPSVSVVPSRLQTPRKKELTHTWGRRALREPRKTTDLKESEKRLDTAARDPS
jgi:hypothetical protein